MTGPPGRPAVPPPNFDGRKVARMEPEPEPEPKARAYCTSILWGRSCRYGDTCDYGHDVPEHLLAAQV